MNFEKYLEEIGDVGRPLTTSRLSRLSNLSAEESASLARAWPRIPAPRKERLVKLLIGLSEDNPELDFEAVYRLCLDDPDAAVRVAGIEGLFECTERWLLDRLIVVARRDQSEEVREAAAKALGRFALRVELGEAPARDAAKIDEVLLAVFDDEAENLHVRRKALESLGVRSTKAASAAIRRAYDSDQPDLRLGAIYAMGQSADPQWLNAIIQELSSGDPETRFEAAAAIGEMEDESAVPYLVPLIADEDLQVRIAAIMALGHVGGARAREELRRCLSSPDDQVREAAEEALEELSFSHDPFAFGFEQEGRG